MCDVHLPSSNQVPAYINRLSLVMYIAPNVHCCAVQALCTALLLQHVADTVLHGMITCFMVVVVAACANACYQHIRRWQQCRFGPPGSFKQGESPAAATCRRIVCSGNAHHASTICPRLCGFNSESGCELKCCNPTYRVNNKHRTACCHVPAMGLTQLSQCGCRDTDRCPPASVDSQLAIYACSSAALPHRLESC
jgi:hypothetical protein